MHASPEAAQLLLGGIAMRERAARLERRGRALELGRRAVLLAGRGERAAGEHPRERRLDDGADLLGGRRGRQRALGRCGGLAGAQRDRRRRALRPGDGHRQPEGGRMRLGRRRGPRRVVAAIEVGVGRRQRLEADARHAPGIAPQRPSPVVRTSTARWLRPAITDARATVIAAHADRTLSSSRCVSSSASSAISSAAATSPARAERSERLRSIHAMLCVMPASRAASTPASSTSAASPSRPRMKCAAPSAGISVGCRWPAARPSLSARSACATASS